MSCFDCCPYIQEDYLTFVDFFTKSKGARLNQSLSHTTVWDVMWKVGEIIFC